MKYLLRRKADYGIKKKNRSRPLPFIKKKYLRKLSSAKVCYSPDLPTLGSPRTIMRIADIIQSTGCAVHVTIPKAKSRPFGDVIGS